MSCYRAFSSALALAALSACGSSESAQPSAAQTIDPQNPKPTIVLAHGAFADASSWSGVIERLEQRGYPVIAPPNPLRGPDSDAAALASVLKTINGPIVLAGHSYGGIVISQAAQDNPAVKALVYIAAFMPDTGESVVTITGKFAPTKFGPAVLRAVPYALSCGAGNGSDTYLKSEAFHDVFAPDVPESTARVMAATQRPIEGAAIPANFTGTPAWKTIPSWALVSRLDQMISPDAERFMAQRAKSHIVEVDASHAVAVSQPDAVANLIVDAAHSVHVE
ncbi:alpha/beta hydrolase [Pendulispora brunnea]|uniref:Alpha/beta hydrolase n=1 Tax=Pendulispora brunnea TaxID=2905690 RepID=A0ABZ2JUF3_9BACT